MHYDLLGYLLGALDPEEHRKVQQQLARDPALRRELANLRRALRSLGQEETVEPPIGLAGRATQFVQRRDEALRRPPAIDVSLAAAPRWSWLDIATASAILLVAAALLLPAVAGARGHSERLACQDNLQNLSQALTTYSLQRDGRFPVPAESGNLAIAGVYAPILRDHLLIDGDQRVVCPASALANNPRFEIPTLAELRAARGAARDLLQEQAGGSYASTLGYVDGRGRLRGRRSVGGTHFAVLSDAPSRVMRDWRSANHGGCGQNVLYADGGVRWQATCQSRHCRDQLFLNDAGKVAAGLHEGDSVLGASNARPFPGR